MAVRRPRSVSGPLDVTAWRGADRTQAHRRAPLPQINTPDPQARRSLKKEGTEELDGTQQNVTLLQNKVTQRREALAKQQDLVENTRTLDNLLHESANQLTSSPTCDEPASASRRPRRRSKTSPDLLRSLDGMEPLGTSPQSAAVEARPSTGRNRAGDLASLLDNALLGGVGAPGAVHTGTNGAPRAEVRDFGSLRAVAGRKDLVQQLCVGNHLDRTVELFHRVHHNGFGSGLVNRGEFFQTLLAVVKVCDRAEVNALFDRFDHDASGYVSYREFQTAIKREQRAMGTPQGKAAAAVPDAQEAAWAESAKLRWRKAAEDLALSPGTIGGGGGFRAAAAAEASRLNESSHLSTTRTTGATSTINPAMPPAALHLMTKKELIRLVRTYTEQKQAGVCRVTGIRQLVKMSYPKAPAWEVDSMVAFIRSMKSFEATAFKEAEEGKREVEELFLALDTDCGGSISLGEFLQLSGSTGETPERLTDLFMLKDADGNGTLDMQEFVCLVDECDLLSHREAIIKRGAALKNERKPAFLQEHAAASDEQSTATPAGVGAPLGTGGRGMFRSKSEGSYALSDKLRLAEVVHRR